MPGFSIFQGSSKSGTDVCIWYLTHFVLLESGWGASLFLFWQEHFLHFSQDFTFCVMSFFRLLSLAISLYKNVDSLLSISFCLRLLLYVEYVVSCLVDILTHLLPSHCCPLLPFYVFLGALLLVHNLSGDLFLKIVIYSWEISVSLFTVFLCP